MRTFIKFRVDFTGKEIFGKVLVGDEEGVFFSTKGERLGRLPSNE